MNLYDTFASLPSLKNRNLIVLSRHEYPDTYTVRNNSAYCYRTETEILNLHSDFGDNLVCIGGAKTYEIFLPTISEFYVTHVSGIYEADVFMPPFEHLFSKQEIVREFDGHKVVKYTK